MKVYTVAEVFEILENLKITSNIESVRRWLREGKIKGIAPVKRKEGWTVTKEDLDSFIAERMPINFNATIVVNESPSDEVAELRERLRVVSEQLHQSRENELRVNDELLQRLSMYNQLHEQLLYEREQRLDEAAIREDQSRKEWYKYFSKGFVSDTVEVKKTQIKDALEHLQLSGNYATQLYNDTWARLEKSNWGRGKQVKVAVLDGYLMFEGQRIKLSDSYALQHERVLYPIIDYIRQNRQAE